MNLKNPIQKYIMSFIKGFFILSILYIGSTNIWFAEDWLVFTVEWKWTSFSVSNFCQLTGTWFERDSDNRPKWAIYTNNKIKYWDNEISIDCSKMYQILWFLNNANPEITFWNNQNFGNITIWNTVVKADYYTTWFAEDEIDAWSFCAINILDFPKIYDVHPWNGDTYNYKISNPWKNTLYCNLKYKQNLTHTITIQDWLYSTQNYDQWQIINIKIGLNGYYQINEWLVGQQTFNNGNVTTINQMKWLPKLKTLDLSNNKILSTDFLNSEHTNNIQEIDLSNNQISSIDNSTWKCSSLKKLNLSSNKISTIKFKSLTNLKYLDLSHNQLSLLESKVFSTLNNLTWLDLQWQQSSKLTIKQYAFSWLNKLENLYLQDNKIENLEWRTFFWLTNIKSFNIENWEIESINPDTNYSDYFPFDNFGTHTWEISVNLSNNSLNTIPTSIEKLMSGHYTFLTLTNSNEVRIWKTYTPRLILNLKNNPINYVKIKNKSITAGENTFERYWFSKDQDNPKYKRDIKDNSWNIIQSWATNSNHWENETTVTLNEHTKWTFNIYLLNTNWEIITSDSLNISTSSASKIDIYAQWWSNQLESDTTFDKNWNIKIKFVWDPFLSSNVYYTYIIRKGSKTYLTWTFNDNIYEDTYYFENWTYNLYIKMCEADSECSSITNWIKTSKSINFTVNIPYENNTLNITYPESNTEIENTVDHISRTHDRNYCNSSFDYWAELSWFFYTIANWNWTNFLSWFKKLNWSNNWCRDTWYEINTNNLNLPNWKYTLTIKEIDKYWNAIKSENITFQKWKIRKVYFNTNWWTTINMIEIGNWETLSMPQNPTKNWYTFLWRYTNSSLTTEYNFNSPITQDTTLYAKREKDNQSPTPQTYTLTINYLYSDWWSASPSITRNFAAWDSYSITSPTISNYNASTSVVRWTMPSSDRTIDVVYTKKVSSGWWSSSSSSDSYSNDLSIRLWDSNPYTDERIKLIIDVNKKYTWKVYFPKLQYYNTSSSKRTNINTSSTSYISDYCDDLDIGYVKFTSSDDWRITISRFIKFAKAGKYRIYAEDKDWDDYYIQFTVDWDNSSSDNYNTEDSNISLSVSNSQPKTYKPIDVTLKTDNYVGKIKLYAKYKDSSNSRVKISNNSSYEYFSDYSNIWENWYYKMISSDKWKKTLYGLIEFKKEWSYRIYAEDEQWYSNYTSIDVNSSTNTTTKTNTWDDIDKLINQLLWTDTTTTENNKNIDDGIERNKKNLKDINDEIYKSRSCKEYRIQYDSTLWAFTSPDLQKKEYFINKEYFKRYIDSKNPQKEWCPTNVWWISVSYKDSSTSTNHFVAPNWKVYFISIENWSYHSNNLTTQKKFSSITEIKNFIKNRNPLIWMETKK